MSIVTEEHVSALRAMLVEDLIEYELLVGRLKDTGRLHGLGTLVAAAFYEAVYRRFGDGYTIAEVIGFIGDERARFSDPEDDFDPRVAERLVCAVLGQGSAGGMDKETEGRAQLALLAGLISHENLDEAGLDQFIEEVRKVADASVERPYSSGHAGAFSLAFPQVGAFRVVGNRGIAGPCSGILDPEVWG